MAVVGRTSFTLFLLSIRLIASDDPLKIYRFDVGSQELHYSIDTSITSDLCDQLFNNCPERINEIITLLKDPNRYEHCLPTKLLLVGPPGVGKTTLSFAIARQTERSCLFINAPTLANEFKNSGAQNLQKQIDVALSISTPIIIIIDEITALTDHYKDPQNQDSNMTQALWLALDQCSKNKNVFIIGTSNDASTMPDQLKNRFEGQVIQINLGNDNEAQFNTIKFHLNKFIHLCDDKVIKTFIKKIKHFAPRQIEELVKQAAQHVELKSNTPCIQSDHLYAVLNNFYESEKCLNRRLSFDWDKWGTRLSSWSSVLATGFNLGILSYCVASGKISQVYNSVKG